MNNLDIIIMDYLASIPEDTEEYFNGKTALLGKFTGEIMKKTKNKYDPKEVINSIKSELESIKLAKL
jgi:Asp-tRNA(Asn)/Glu-tRNA(Gln) amidotransferase B subunit